MPRSKKAYGWINGNSVMLSLLPKASGGAANAYSNPSDALADAHARGLVIEWEDRAAVDRWKAAS